MAALYAYFSIFLLFPNGCVDIEKFTLKINTKTSYIVSGCLLMLRM